MNASLRGPAGLLGLFILAACGAGESQTDDEAPGAVAMWPVTTASEEARRLVNVGVREEDTGNLWNNLGPSEEANERYKRAIALDPNFAFAYLRAAVTAPSLDEYRANLQRASELAQHASETERLLIAMEQSVFQNDMEGALQTAQRLLARDSAQARAWFLLAGIQSRMGEEQEARASATRATEIAPDFLGAHMWLGNSYLTFSPEDPARAEAHIRRAVVLEPTHPHPHDLLGDLYRARGEFPAAVAAYTRSAELSPPGEGGQAFQQRGNAHTFSGNYARARADYDTSMARSTGDSRAIYAAYRPLVQVHEGNPRAAVQELETVVGEIDGMGAADPDEMKVLTLDMQAIIAQHHGLLIPAERAVERLSEIWRRRAAEVGTDDFRRDRESEIAFWEGTLAARRGDYALARKKAAESMSLREADRDPTKDWRGQLLLGLTAQLEGKHAEAVSHYERTDPNNVYATYHRALALEALGRTEEAKEIYRQVANINFNDPAVALVRKDAIAKAR